MIYSSFAKAYKRLDYHQNILALHIKIKNNLKILKWLKKKELAPTSTVVRNSKWKIIKISKYLQSVW